MDKVAMVKKEVQMQNWSEAELARQESGLTVTQWCRQKKISTSAYYYSPPILSTNRHRILSIRH